MGEPSPLWCPVSGECSANSDDDDGGGSSRTVSMPAVGEWSSQWQEWKSGVVLTVRAARASDDNQVSIARLGGLDAVLGALRRHEESAAVAEQACCALRNLAVNGERRAHAWSNARACYVCGMWCGMGLASCAMPGRQRASFTFNQLTINQSISQSLAHSIDQCIHASSDRACTSERTVYRPNTSTSALSATTAPTAD